MRRTLVNDADNFYDSRKQAADAELARLAPKDRALSWYRLVAFTIAIAVFLVYGWSDAIPTTAAWTIGLGAVAAFVALVLRHRRIRRDIERHSREAAICEEGRRRIARDWQSLEPLPSPDIPDPYGIARDLDLFGPTSVYRLTGGAVTRFGQRTLARWLLVPSPPKESLARGTLIEALRRNPKLLMDAQHLVREMGGDTLDPEPFVQWAKGRPWLDAHRSILVAARLLAPLPLLLGLGAALNLLPGGLWILAIGANILFSAVYGPRVHRIFNAVSMHKRRIDQYSALFRFIAEAPLEAERGRRIQAALSADGLSAWRQMKKLEDIAGFADLRFSPMTHFPVQALTLVDFHVLAAMEKWQTRAGAHTEQWLEALGEFEGLLGLSILAHDNPDYTVATVVSEGPPRFEAVGLRHPLLPPTTAVANDVALGPPGTFLLVTGSNMSGKSSLLRSIGINIALAGAGGPVAAERLTLTPFVLGTSFRVTDSISDGVSFFMAELKRLKQIVSRGEERADDAPPLLFLLDEILQGTNIIERRIAVTGVLKHLMKLGCVGAISSHDLTLAEAEEIGDKATPVYFTERFRDGEHGREMYFDYKLRTGVAPTTNALELLRLVGLTFDD